jgi:hypothetical protein
MVFLEDPEGYQVEYIKGGQAAEHDKEFHDDDIFPEEQHDQTEQRRQTGWVLGVAGFARLVKVLISLALDQGLGEVYIYRVVAAGEELGIEEQ